ncbi:MAG: transglutaminase-like cysteine peptidase [Holosporales bacterium]|jgi:predicted transglutaminase-like cysteine proteinase
MQQKALRSIFRPCLKSALVIVLVSIGKPAAANWLETSTAVVPPVGFIKFCVENMEQCSQTMASSGYVKDVPILTEKSWQDLVTVQEEVNSAYLQVNDIISVGIREDWSLGRDGRADCEDFSLIKRQALIDKGWPAHALLLTTAFTERNEYHVVLTVVTDRGDVILDNRWATPRPVESLDYKWVARQDPKNPMRWLRLSALIAPEQPLALYQQVAALVEHD